MEFEVVWKENKSGQLASLNLRDVAGAKSIEHLSEDWLVESFCLPSCVLTVFFDSIPLCSATICISDPHSFQFDGIISTFSKPVRAHYGFATTCAGQWSQYPRDAYFSQLDGLVPSFTADIDFASFEDRVLGLSFVVELENGSWLKRAGADFYVGGGLRAVPCSVEVPLSLPGSTEIVHGQMLSLFRANPFWLQPMFNGLGLHSCKQETQFVLARLLSSSMTCVHAGDVNIKHSSNFFALLSIIDVEHELRTSIFGVDGGSYPAIRVENGRCSPLHFNELQNATVCVASITDSPYDAVKCVVAHSAVLLKTFCSRESKISTEKWNELSSSHHPGVLNSIGFCTWDAFGHEVCEEKIMNSVRWLRAEGIEMSYIIVDDGWQAGGDAGPDHVHVDPDMQRTSRQALSSFKANEKFGGSLRSLKQDSGLEIIAWTAIIGYWGGLSGIDCEIDTIIARGALPQGLFENGLEDPLYWRKDYEVVYPCEDSVDTFFDSYMSNNLCQHQGVSGVKVDAQSILEILCNTDSALPQGIHLSRSSITSIFRVGLAKSVEKAFPRTVVLNCMACGPETIFHSGAELSVANVCWRTSNDHAFPGVDETSGSVGWHIICNSMTSLLLGEIFPVTDWDMFRVCDKFAAIHAAARIVSGGPFYISDSTPFEAQYYEGAKSLLRSATTAAGQFLRCENPGRPTIDSLFRDPRLQPLRIFKIFNRSTVLGLVALFNFSGECVSLDGTFAPNDVEDFARLPCKCGYISLVTGGQTYAFHHHTAAHSCKLTLPGMSASLAHICPIFRVGEGLIAVLGQPELLNSGATVASISSYAICGHFPAMTIVDCEMLDMGETYTWVDDETLRRLADVTELAGDVSLGYDLVTLGNVRFLVINMPSSKPYGFRFFLNDTHGKYANSTVFEEAKL